MLILPRSLEEPVRVTTASSMQPLTSVHPFGLVFAQRRQIRFTDLGMTHATANGTTSNDGSEEFDWIDDDN